MMGVNDIVCVLMLVYASLYYMYHQDMVSGLSRPLSRYSQNYTIKGLGIKTVVGRQEEGDKWGN